MVTERGLVAFQSHYSVLLGRCLCMLGRFEEAAPLAAFARGVEPEWGQLDTLEARLLAHRGEHAEAERLARHGVALGEKTDQLTYQGDSWWDLAEVLIAAGKASDAVEAFEQALHRYERKRNLAMAAQVLPRLEALRAGTLP